MAGNSFYYLEETAAGWVLLAVENDGDHGTGPCWARCNGPNGCGYEWTFRGQFAKLDKWSE